MAESNLHGPAALGTSTPTGSGAGGNYGWVECIQKQTIVQNSTTAVSVTFYLPYSSGPANTIGTYYPQISEIWADVTTAYNSATSATLSVGKTAGGTEFASGIDVKGNSTTRVTPAYTTTQATNIQNVGQNTVVATITVVGATSAGTVTVYLRYTFGQALQPNITT